MPDHDDRHWLDAVAGRPSAAEAQLATVKEGAVVREAMLAAQRTLPRFDADSGARQLIRRLREEKLFEAPGLARFGWKIPAVAAAVALAIAFGIASRERPGGRSAAPEVPVMTGDPDAAQALVTFETRDIADEIRDRMNQAGLSPAVTEIGALTRFEAEWPRRPSDQQIEFLKDYGFARPAGARLRIEIRPPQQ